MSPPRISISGSPRAADTDPRRPQRRRPDDRGTAARRPLSGLAASSPRETAAAAGQDPGQRPRDEHLADVDQEVEPAHGQLAGDPAGGGADQDAPGREDPSPDSTRDEVGDDEPQHDPAA